MSDILCKEVRYTIRLPLGTIEEIDRRVKDGYAMNRADYIRGAIYNRLCE